MLSSDYLTNNSKVKSFYLIFTKEPDKWELCIKLSSGLEVKTISENIALAETSIKAYLNSLEESNA